MKKVFLRSIPLLVLIVVLALVVGRKIVSKPADQVTESSVAQSNALGAGAKETAEKLSTPEVLEPPREPVLSDSVRAILSDDTPYMIRANLIKALGRTLSAEDVAALREFLMTSTEEHSGLRPIALNSLKNDVLDVLIDQDVMPEGLGGQVIDMFNDPEADYMWREYCLQFMQPLYERQLSANQLTVNGSEAVDAGELQEINRQAAIDNRQLLKDALVAALDERDEDLAGTALLGLNRLARDYDDVRPDQVIIKAVEIAGDKNASDRCRLTAMRVAAAGNCDGILPTARELVLSAKTDLLRAAAITTLGDFADPQDKALLIKIAAIGNRQLAAAARSALAQYSK